MRRGACWTRAERALMAPGAGELQQPSYQHSRRAPALRLPPRPRPGRSLTITPTLAQLAVIGAVACATLVAAPMLLSSYEPAPAALEQANFEKLSANLLSGLQSAMDMSVDSKVQQFMSAPRGAPMVPVPAMQGYHRLLPFDPHPYVTQTQLDRLLAEKRELEHKREAIIRTLRLRREAAAAKAAKDAANLDRIRLQRAVTAAKKRQLEMAQRAARAAAQEMQQAAVAKEQAMHAASVAEARQKELAYMSSVNEEQSEHAAEMANQEDAANDMQYQQDKSAVDEKLQAYLLQEKDLLHKIAAAEQVAAHGGQWPAEGMPKSISPYMAQMGARNIQLGVGYPGAAQQSLAQRRSGASKVQREVVKSIESAVEENKSAIDKDTREAMRLSKQSSNIMDQIQQLRANDQRLSKELVQAELKRVQH